MAEHVLSTWPVTLGAIASMVMAVNTDFGQAADDRRLLAARNVGLVPGQPVLMRDGEGNSCHGVVECVDRRVAWILPDWRTWIRAEEPQQ